MPRGLQRAHDLIVPGLGVVPVEADDGRLIYTDNSNEATKPDSRRDLPLQHQSSDASQGMRPPWPETSPNTFLDDGLARVESPTPHPISSSHTVITAHSDAARGPSTPKNEADSGHSS